MSKQTSPMKNIKAKNVAIIGAGKMAHILSGYFARAGHRVRIGARESDSAEQLAKDVGYEVNGGTIEQAVAHSDIVFFAVPYLQLQQTAQSAGSLQGKIVIDISNPFKSDFSGLLLGGDTSAAEELAKSLPDAKVIKAFNTVFAAVLERGADYSDQRAQIFYAGDDAEAKQAVKELIQATGFEPIDCGPLFSARFMEPLAALVIQIDNHLTQPMQITAAMLSRPRAA